MELTGFSRIQLAPLYMQTYMRRHAWWMEERSPNPILHSHFNAPTVGHSRVLPAECRCGRESRDIIKLLFLTYLYVLKAGQRRNQESQA